MKRNIIIALLFLSLTGCVDISSNICHDEIKYIKYSTDRRYEIIVFIRDCGATTDYSSQIKIKDNQQNTEEIIFIGSLDESMKVEWENEKIKIYYYKKDIYKILNEYHGVEIELVGVVSIPGVEK